MFIVDYRDKVPDTFNFYILGDEHEGRNGIATKKIEKAVQMIRADKNARWANVGDAAEATFIHHPYYSTAVHAGKAATADLQVEVVVKRFTPIGEKCLAMLDGNHEERWIGTTDMSMNIATALSNRSNRKELIPFGGRTCKLLFTDDTKIFLTHGTGVVNSKAGDPEQREVNDGISIKRRLRDMPRHDCIVNFMGHIHKARISAPSPRLAVVGAEKLHQVYPSVARDNSGYIPEEFCWFGSTGGFLQGYPATPWTHLTADTDKSILQDKRSITTYVEKAGYTVVEIAIIKVVIKKRVVVSVERITL